MFVLLADMFKRGNPIDIAWFLVGGWLLLLFLGLMIAQIVRRVRNRKPPRPPLP